jgi:hypothetical protein
MIRKICWQCSPPVLLVLFIGCGPIETKTTGDEHRTTTAVTLDKDELERDKAEFQRRANERLRDLDARMAKLRADADHASADAKVRVEKEISEQQAQLDRVQADLKQLQETTAEKWNDFRLRSAAALDDLDRGLNDAISRFK